MININLASAKIKPACYNYSYPRYYLSRAHARFGCELYAHEERESIKQIDCVIYVEVAEIFNIIYERENINTCKITQRTGIYNS